MAKKVPKSKPVMGRPREHDREQIALDFIEWARNPNSTNLNQFCSTREPPLWPGALSIWSAECKDFKKAYETGKTFLAYRREQMLSDETLHVKAYDLNAKTYDYFLKEEHRAESEFQASLKKDEDKQIGTIEFKVNYAPGSGDTIQISPQAISTKNPPSSR